MVLLEDVVNLSFLIAWMDIICLSYPISALDPKQSKSFQKLGRCSQHIWWQEGWKFSLLQLKTEKSIRRVLDQRSSWSCAWKSLCISTLWSLICRELLSVRQLWVLSSNCTFREQLGGQKIDVMHRLLFSLLETALSWFF